ncbi:MAG TPA: hypothetical protein VI603_05920 [Saprospiraceae bacterium]|nr:hypothetical protein [Saprospiraceae bacterium]
MKQYLNEINNRFQYRATWEPNKTLAIGDIGILEKGIFSLRSTLAKENIPPTIRTDENEGSMKYTSEGAVDITAKLSGQTSMPQSGLAQGDAGITIQFKKQDAVVFQINGSRTHQIENTGEIEREVLQRFRENKWPKDWVIITELVQAKEATILISNSKDSKIELKANANVHAASDLDIADAQLQFGVVAKRGIATEIIAKEGITPLYRVSGIKKPVFGDPSLGTKELFGEVLDEVPFDPKELE